MIFTLIVPNDMNIWTPNKGRINIAYWKKVAETFALDIIVNILYYAMLPSQAIHFYYDHTRSLNMKYNFVRTCRDIYLWLLLGEKRIVDIT